MTDDDLPDDFTAKVKAHAKRLADILMRSPDLQAITFRPQGYDISFEGRGPSVTDYPLINQADGPTLLGLRRAVLIDDGEDGKGRLLNKATVGIVVSQDENDPGRSSWTLWARGIYPWTTPGVSRLLDNTLGSMDALMDVTGRFPVGKLIVLGPGLERPALEDLVALHRREIVILAHAPNAKRRAYYESVLPAMAALSRSSCIFVLYDDPRGASRRQYLAAGTARNSLYSYVEAALPEPGGMIAWLPPFLNSLKPLEQLTNVTRRLSTAAAGDAETLASWVADLLMYTRSATWPRMTMLRSDVAKQIEDYLPTVAEPDLTEQLISCVWGLSTQVNTIQQRLELSVLGIRAMKGRYDQSQGELDELRTLSERHLEALAQARQESAQRRSQLAEVESLCADFERRLADSDAYDIERLIAENQRLTEDQEAALACATEMERRLGEAEKELRRRPSTTPSPAASKMPKQAILGPKGWDDLVAKARENLPWVELPDSAVDVARRQLRGHRKYVATAWRILIVLDAYGETKERARSQGLEIGPDLATMYAFLSAYPCDGLPPSRVLLAESTEVSQNPQIRKQRMLPGPNGERVYMQSNIIVARGGPPSPRLHYFDDTDGGTGLIWVGYIGPHLRNTLT